MSDRDSTSDPAAAACCGPGQLEALQVGLRAELFRSLADPVRLRVVERLALARAPMKVSEVRDCCGVHLSGVSRHLKTLRDAGVVEATKVGREVRYRLSRSDLIEQLRRLADALEATGPPAESPTTSPTMQ